MKLFLSLTIFSLLFVVGCGATQNGGNLNTANSSEQGGSNLTPEEQAAINQALANENFQFDETGEGDENETTDETPAEEEKNPRDTMSEEEVKQAEERDRTRLSHVDDLQKALDKYFKDKKSYPEKLDELVDKYLKELPKDPSTNEVYSYTPIGSLPAKYYDLLYTLEVGVDDKPYGANVASPELKE